MTTIADIANKVEAVAASVNRQSDATSSIAQSAMRGVGNAETVAAALRTAAETINRTQDAAKLVLEFSQSLANRATELDRIFVPVMLLHALEQPQLLHTIRLAKSYNAERDCSHHR